MHRSGREPTRWAMVVLPLALLSGCAGMGWEDILTGLPVGGDIRGEIAWVDQRSREIGVTGSWSRRETVRYDSRTRVIYGQRSYRVEELRRGDLVRIDVGSDYRGRRYARTVRVESSARGSERRRGEARTERFEGRVLWVEEDRGQFGLEAGRYEYTVSLAYRPNRDIIRRFERLRRGDRVRFEGTPIGGGRVELHRFR